MQIDWPGIRAAAMVLGVREAARRAAANLPPHESNRFVDRVLKRCQREQWLKKKEIALTSSTTPRLTREGKAMSAIVGDGASSLINVLSEHSNRSRIGLAKAGTKAAETFARMPGVQVINNAQEFRHITASAAQLHNWNADQRPGSPLNLQVLSQNTVISINEK